MSSFPAEVERRVMVRLNKIGLDVFAILGDLQEHGGQFLNVVLNDQNGRKVRLIVADPSVEIVGDTPAPVLVEHGGNPSRARESATDSAGAVPDATRSS